MCTQRKITPLIVRYLARLITLVVPDDLLNMLGQLRHISVKELHASMKPSPFLVESHPFLSGLSLLLPLPSVAAQPHGTKVHSRCSPTPLPPTRQETPPSTPRWQPSRPRAGPYPEPKMSSLLSVIARRVPRAAGVMAGSGVG